MLAARTPDEAEASQSQGTLILNDLYSQDTHSPAALEQFPNFSRLPKEIRLHIWKLNLQYHRLIGVSLLTMRRKSRPPAKPYSTRNALGNVVSGGRYIVELRTKPCLSPLFQTSCEARQAAMEFYRVHLPCDSPQAKSRIVYLNPEFDFVEVDLQEYGRNIREFLYDLRSYDPRGIGILNLVVGTHQPYRILLPTKPSKPSVSRGEPSLAFTQILGNLRRMIFHHRMSSDTRMINSYPDTLYFNRAFPICSYAEGFELLDRDPRPIDDDLRTISVGFDPRLMSCRWQRMERDFGVTHTDACKYQYLVTHLPGFHVRLRADETILNRNTVDDYLRREEEVWVEEIEDHYGACDDRQVERPDARENDVMPAFGFWLFPSEAFSEVPIYRPHVHLRYRDYPYGSFDRNRKIVVDVTKFRPQIGLVKFLPDCQIAS